MTGLPTNGSTVWIRLWTNFNGTWQFVDYQYTADNGGGGLRRCDHGFAYTEHDLSAHGGPRASTKQIGG